MLTFILNFNAEKWVSGLNQAFAKRSYAQKVYREFKSRLLRHSSSLTEMFGQNLKTN